jgi:hypothetical protein
VLAAQADIARLAGCASVPGLTIRSGGTLDLSPLRALTTITGDLVIGPTVGVEDVTLGALRDVGGTLHVVGNGVMQGLFFRALTQTGPIEIAGNAVLSTIALPALTAVHGALRVTGNASLELLDLSALASVDQELVVRHAPRLTLLDAPQLHAAARVELDAPKLPSEVAAALRAVAPAP